MLDPVTYLLYTLLNLYFYVVLGWSIVSMLISFHVVNPYQPVVAQIFRVLGQLVEPALRPIRRALPTMGTVDLSPLVLLIAIQFLIYCLLYFTQPHVTALGLEAGRLH